MRAERRDAVTLGRVMARSDECNVAFACEQHRLLGYFPSYENIGSDTYRVVEVTLRCAGAPRDTLNRTLRSADHERRAVEAFFDTRGERRERQFRDRVTEKNQFMFAATPVDVQIQMARERYVVAYFRVRIER